MGWVLQRDNFHCAIRYPDLTGCDVGIHSTKPVGRAVLHGNGKNAILDLADFTFDVNKAAWIAHFSLYPFGKLPRLVTHAAHDAATVWGFWRGRDFRFQWGKRFDRRPCTGQRQDRDGDGYN